MDTCAYTSTQEFKHEERKSSCQKEASMEKAASDHVLSEEADETLQTSKGKTNHWESLRNRIQ